MQRTEAIVEAVRVAQRTGITQFVAKRGYISEVFPSTEPTPRGWKVVEMVSRGNMHSYHRKMLHGLCPMCGHYGEDCTGVEPQR